MMFYVYAIMNEYGAVEYVGQTKNLKKRMREHKTKPWFTRSGVLGDGRFYGRNDVTMEAVAEFETREEARQYEGKLKMELGFEWTEFTGRQKGGKIGGKLSGKTQGRNNVESGHLAKIGREANIKKRQPVLAYRKNTGEFVGEYESQSEAARQLGVNSGSINVVLKGISSHTGGYTFQLKGAQL